MIQCSASITLRATYFKNLIISIFHTFCLWVWVFSILLLSHLTAHCSKPVLLNNTPFQSQTYERGEMCTTRKESCPFLFLLLNFFIVLLKKQTSACKKGCLCISYYNHCDANEISPKLPKNIQDPSAKHVHGWWIQGFYPYFSYQNKDRIYPHLYFLLWYSFAKAFGPLLQLCRLHRSHAIFWCNSYS